MKLKIANLILCTLGKAISKLSVLDKSVKKEVETYEDNYIIQIKILPTANNIKLKKQDGKFVLLKKQDVQKADLIINFKTISSAYDTLTGKISIHDAYCQNRLIVQGDIHLAMPLVRILYKVEAYLFPKFISKKILKTKPELTVSRLKVYASLLG